MPVTDVHDIVSIESMRSLIEAEQACWKTYLTYFDVLDQKLSAVRAAECFTEDARIAYHLSPKPLVFQGRADFSGFLVDSLKAYQRTAHVVGQSQFLWRDGSPRLLTSVTAWHWFTENVAKGAMRPADNVVVALSDDEFECTDSGWLISSRTVKFAAGPTAVGSPPPKF